MSGQDGLFGGLAKDERTQESTGKGIPRTVGVNDLVIRKAVDIEGLGLFRLVADNEDGTVGSLCENDNAWSGSIGLGKESDGASDSCEVLDVGVTGRRGPCLSFRLVTDNNVGIRENLLELLGEELGDEGCGDVEDEGLYWESWLDYIVEEMCICVSDLASGG